VATNKRRVPPRDAANAQQVPTRGLSATLAPEQRAGCLSSALWLLAIGSLAVGGRHHRSTDPHWDLVPYGLALSPICLALAWANRRRLRREDWGAAVIALLAIPIGVVEYFTGHPIGILPVL
jgi:hypothetical protein